MLGSIGAGCRKRLLPAAPIWRSWAAPLGGPHDHCHWLVSALSAPLRDIQRPSLTPRVLVVSSCRLDRQLDTRHAESHDSAGCGYSWDYLESRGCHASCGCGIATTPRRWTFILVDRASHNWRVRSPRARQCRARSPPSSVDRSCCRLRLAIVRAGGSRPESLRRSGTYSATLGVLYP